MSDFGCSGVTSPLSMARLRVLMAGFEASGEGQSLLLSPQTSVDARPLEARRDPRWQIRHLASHAALSNLDRISSYHIRRAGST